MLKELQLVPVLRLYKLHPSSMVAGLADQVMGRLSNFLYAEGNRNRTDGAGDAGSKRSANQVGYKDTTVPVACLREVQGALGSATEGSVAAAMLAKATWMHQPSDPSKRPVSWGTLLITMFLACHVISQLCVRIDLIQIQALAMLQAA